MRTRHRHFVASAAVALGVIAWQASAQVVIDMPPPKKLPAASVAVSGATMPAAAMPAASYATATTGVGNVALARYAGARYYAYDTYYNDGMYSNGIRVYSYPQYFSQYIWGPWWGVPFGFPGFCFPPHHGSSHGPGHGTGHGTGQGSGPSHVVGMGGV